jgi:hypothetical protein
LQQLEERRFNGDAVREAEQKVKQSAGVLENSSPAQLAYYEFIQQGLDISDVARRTKAARLRQVWAERGPTFATKLDEVRGRIAEERQRMERAALEQARRQPPIV